MRKFRKQVVHGYAHGLGVAGAECRDDGVAQCNVGAVQKQIELHGRGY